MNVYLDCGGHFGEGLRTFIQKYNMDSSWEIHTWEPNPAALFVLEKTVEELRSPPNNLNIELHRGAILDHEGYSDFSVQLNSTGAGSIEKLMNAGACSDPNSESYRFHNTIIGVPCTDISKVISGFNISDRIIMKIDVEGSEFKILRKLISDGLANRISDIYIEWHDIYMTSETPESRNEIIAQLNNAGVISHIWG